MINNVNAAPRPQTITPADRQRALTRQIARLEARLAERRQRSDRWAAIRLAVFAGGLLACLAVYFFVNPLVFWPALVVWIAAFAASVRIHRRINDSVERHTIRLKLARIQVARMQLDWDAIPQPRVGPAPEGHPFAADLDLVGARSLHHLLDTAVSRQGSQRLLAWLLQTAPDPAQTAARQARVRELIPLTRFRARLLIAAAQAVRRSAEPWDGDRLLARVQDRLPLAAIRPTLLLLGGLAGVNIVLLLLNLVGVLPELWIITWLIYGGLYIARRELIAELFDATLDLTDALRRLEAVLRVLERYPYSQHPQLGAVVAPLLAGRNRPSATLRRVTRITSAASLQGNPLIWLPLNAIVPWDLFFAYQFNANKALLAEVLPGWLDALFEVEALNSLANYAYLHPDYPFPQIIPDMAHRPVLLGAQLGHPLLPRAGKVRNDFRLEEPGSIVIVTGSNMSGKSSFLRTVGLNMQLAWAGSVVDAAALDLTPFRLFSCIRVTDSLVDGISYFYAEVRRLRALLDALDVPDAPPLFFLIDEIFRGTNNRERLIGSRAYLQALAARGATGLVATHDLELVQLAEDRPHVINMHLREHVADGQMHFDYTLRPGPCPTTNALVIMEMAGLPVTEPGQQKPESA